MIEYSKTELESAKKAILSSIHKIEKAQETWLKKQPPPKPQLDEAIKKLEDAR